MGDGRTRNTNLGYARGLGRALVGAVLFALPLFMTMEMWRLGFTIAPARMATMLGLCLPLLIALSHVAGFERSARWSDHVLDAFAAFSVAVLAAGAVLALLGVLSPFQPLREIVGKITVCALPAAIGALLADKQLGDETRASGQDGEPSRKLQRSYLGRLFVMSVGALFVALNVAPTEEMVLIAYQISPLQAVFLGLVSLGILHALLFWVAFPGRKKRVGDANFASILLRYSCAGYGLCLLSSLALLWVFGRLDGVSFGESAEFVVVLSFPAAIGAGLAHFVIGGDGT